jgi:hypothetical protein
MSLSGACQRYYPAEKDTAFDNGSNVVFPELDDKIIDNLDLLGKVWGFLKYHHPAIAKGNYNWDYELFRFLPEYLNVTHNKQRDELLLNWIEKYGEIPECQTCKETPKDAFLKPDFSWLKKSDVSKALKNKIMEIYHNRHQEKHYYINMKYGRYPDFLHENEYANMPYPDKSFRLLTLYRYWNIIQYFFPYRYLTDKDWNTIHRTYIAKFINAKNELEYELIVLQLIGEVNDTHAILCEGNNKIQESRGNYYAPFRVQFIENQLVVTDYYNPELQSKAMVQIGDIITHIAEKPIQRITDSLKIYYPASNDAARKRDMSFDMLRHQKRYVDIQYITGNEKKKTNLALYERDSLNMYGWVKEVSEKCYKLLNNDIGYIRLGGVTKEDIPIIKQSLKNTKYIIVDFRKWVSPDSYSLYPYFFKERKTYAKVTLGNINNPDEFTFVTPIVGLKSKEYYQGKIVLLVNECTQSGSEWNAMLLQSVPHAIVVGSTTAGADGNVSTFCLPGGLKTRISGIGVYYPDGRATQRVGIVPDIKVTPTIEGIKAGRDEVLEKAIEIINKK